MGAGPLCSEDSNRRDLSQHANPGECSFSPHGAWHTSLALLAMLAHPALSQACISVYIAVYRVYVFIPGQVWCSAALA